MGKFDREVIEVSELIIADTGKVWDESVGSWHSINILDNQTKEVINGGGDLVQFKTDINKIEYLFMIEINKDGQIILHGANFKVVKDHSNTMVVGVSRG